MIYLDHAATTAMYPQAVHRMMPYFSKIYFNPSGGYEAGSFVHNEIEQTRQILAEEIHAKPKEIYFTSGGTEGDNWALVNTIRNYAWKGKHIITTQIEHHAVLHTCHFLETQGFRITYLPVNREGIIDMDTLYNAICPDTILISVMAANNEIGTLQPIEEIGILAKENDILFHTDAVQFFGHMPIYVDSMHIDMMSVSAHKFGGPKGIGFFYARDNITLSPLFFGGSQEDNLRAGTENVAGILGMQEAVKLSVAYREKHYEREQMLRDYLAKRIFAEIPNVYLNGSLKQRLPGNLNLCFDNVEAHALIAMLEQDGICVSGGSACTTSNQEPSHVLLALGLSKEAAESSIRITIGYENTIHEMNYVFRCIKNAVKTLRAL